MSNERFTFEDLAKKGFVQRTDGSWHKPSTPVLDRLQGREHGQQEGASDGKAPQKRVTKAGRAKSGGKSTASKGARRKRGHSMIVTLTCHVPRYFDSDNATIATKAIRDELADWIGIDDGDHRILWEVDQTLTRGTPGVCVAIRHV